MRLINVKNLTLEDVGSHPKRYAILSHTWGADEVTFEEMVTGTGTSKAGYQKILLTCRQAEADGLEYAWVDTCCINKGSSSEISESINSMVWWYHEAEVCYVYLEDIPISKTFEEARWFSRGWTLQELLAPTRVLFYDRLWGKIGTREQWARDIERATKIDWEALQGENTLAYVRSTSVAKRMAWAAKRQVTRAEDTAYCLLGLFDVNMPLLYGEGGPKAFERLQEEIIKRNLDQSFLVQIGISGPTIDKKDIPLFAQSPRFFEGCEKVLTTGETVAPFSLNNQGLQLQAPIFQVPGRRNKYIAVLACVQDISSAQRLGLPLRAIERTGKLLVREATSELYTVPEPALRAASIRDFCILRQAPINIPRLLSIRVIQDWDVIYRRETLYQEESKDRKRGWKRLEAREGVIKIPPPDRLNCKSPCYGVLFTNPYMKGSQDGWRRPLWPTSGPGMPGRDVYKILVRADLDAISRYSATVSIDRFWDNDWVHCRDLGAVPNTTVFRITPATTQTLDLGTDRQPNRLVTSISWKRTAGQDVLRLDIKIIDSSLWGRIRAIFPSFERPQATIEPLLYLAALIGTARLVHHFTRLWVFCFVAELAKMGLLFCGLISYLKMCVGPPSIWTTSKWALCFPAFTLIWPMTPSAVHFMMLAIWPVDQKFYGFEGKIGILIGLGILYVGILLGMDLAKRWPYHICSTIGLQILSTLSKYYGVKWIEEISEENLTETREDKHQEERRITGGYNISHIYSY